MQTPTTNDTKAWNTRADLLQRVPDEGLAEIRERWADVPTMGVGIWEHGDSLYEEAEPHRTVGHLHGQIKRDTAIALSRSKSDIDYLLSLLQQPPAASERCGECGHERFLNEEICTFIPEPSTGVICGHRCIPATGATTEHET